MDEELEKYNQGYEKGIELVNKINLMIKEAKKDQSSDYIYGLIDAINDDLEQR